jgi:hypothetical protein
VVGMRVREESGFQLWCGSCKAQGEQVIVFPSLFVWDKEGCWKKFMTWIHHILFRKS